MSLLDNEDIIVQGIVESQIERWLEENCLFKKPIPEITKNYEILYINNEYIVNTFTDTVITNKDLVELPYNLFRFNNIDGYFNISELHNLKTLRGCPRSIKYSFYCMHNKSLKSLEYGSKIVGGNYNCYACTSLVSLNGLPIQIGNDLILDECRSLQNLDYFSDLIMGSFYFRNCSSLSDVTGLIDKSILEEVMHSQLVDSRKFRLVRSTKGKITKIIYSNL